MCNGVVLIMDEKIKIHHDRIINKKHSDADKLISYKKGFSTAYDFIINSVGDIPSKENLTGVSEIILSLQKHADGGLAGVVNSLQQQTNRGLCELLDSIKLKKQKINRTVRIGEGIKDSYAHSTPKDDYPTVARLLGEVISDFLVGLSKNENNLIVQNIATSISSCFENIESIRLPSSRSLLNILELLSSPIAKDNCKASNDKIHQLKIDNNETN